MSSKIGIFFILLQISLALSETKPLDLIGVGKGDVAFHLFTRSNPDTFIQLNIGELNTVNIDPSKPFKFIIHGYTNTGYDKWVMSMKDAYLTKGEYNVVAVDWGSKAASLYPLSAYYTRGVGKYIALLAIDLNSTFGVPFSNIHLIGHSLGAHASGFAGQYMNDNAKGVIGRITGMDPAGPLFVGLIEEDRLSPDDASFVDIIHTDGLATGYYDPCGHVDFYPNGGLRLQPGCYTRWNLDFLGCSHIRSLIFFTESINSDGFVSTSCDSWTNYKNGMCTNNPKSIMGDNVDPQTKGSYYLSTNAVAPFARNGQI